jgi:flagellar L-ring protein precursor FlgH
MSRILLALLLAAGCATHIAPYKPKTRKYVPGEYASSSHATGASLYVEGQRGLFEDDRASRVGDIIVVRIVESETGTHSATAKLARKSESDYGVPSSGGILNEVTKKAANFDPSSILSTSSNSSHDGSGTVERRGTLTATLPVRIRQVMPNGDFFIEGSKVVMVNNEEHHLYVSGVVRAADVRADNSVLSSQIADAEIELTGRGDVSDQQRQGWLSRIVGALWPF